MSIVCSGSVAYDYLMRFPGRFKDHILPEHLANVSLSFLVDDMTKLRGGIAPNISYSFALLGQKPILFAAVGEDFADYRQWLTEHGVDCAFARVIPGKYTASFFANTDLSNAQIASFYSGAMANSGDIKLSELDPADVELFIISPSDPVAMIGYAKQAKELGIPYAFDPSQQIIRMNKEQLREGIVGAKFLFCNEYEFELLKKHSEWSEAEILRQTEITVITLGEEGSRIIANGTEFLAPIYPAERIADPTGVGDAYRSGFLTGYYKGFPLEICGKMGALVSTYVLEQVGTQTHSFTIDEFKTRFRERWDDQGALDAL